MKKIRNKCGEGYIDVAVTILVFSFALVFMVNIVSLVALSQNMKTAADQIAEYAALNGTTDIEPYINLQREKVGADFTCSFEGSQTFDGTGKVQLGDRIECTLTYQLNFLGFGNAIHITTITSAASGISEVYWK